MTYNSKDRDPPVRHRGEMIETNHTAWILGGLAALALVLGGYFMMGSRSLNNTASISDRGMATTAPLTPVPNLSAPASNSNTSTPGSGTAR